MESGGTRVGSGIGGYAATESGGTRVGSGIGGYAMAATLDKPSRITEVEIILFIRFEFC